MNKILTTLCATLFFAMAICYAKPGFSKELSLTAPNLLHTKITTALELDILWEGAIVENSSQYIDKILSTYEELVAENQLEVEDVIFMAKLYGDDQEIERNSEKVHEIITKYQTLGTFYAFSVAGSALWSIGSNAQSLVFYPLNELVVLRVQNYILLGCNQTLNDSLSLMIKTPNLALYGSKTGQCG